jgi:hypothetical protein
MKALNENNDGRIMKSKCLQLKTSPPQPNKQRIISMKPGLYLPEQNNHTPPRIIGCDELLDELQDSEEINQYELEDEDLIR